jgi:hypothetical protein
LPHAQGSDKRFRVSDLIRTKAEGLPRKPVGHSDMRLPRLYILFTAAVLLACAWLSLSRPPASAGGDVSVVLLGLTNSPGSSVPYKRLFVMGDGHGLHALFAVTNISQRQYVKFGIAAVETRDKEGWRALEPVSDKPELGNGFSPGYGYRYAIPWPAGVQTDQPWRLRLWVTRERRLFSMSLHHRGFGRALFRPYGRHTVTSEVVTPPSAAVTEPGAEVGNAHNGPAHRSQSVPPGTNSTPPPAGPGR